MVRTMTGHPRNPKGRTPGQPDKFTDDVRAAYLQALEKLGTYSAAAAAVGICTATSINYRKKHPEFQRQCDGALGRLEGQLMETVRKLAVDGVQEPVYDKNGEQIGSKRKYSPQMLLAWLKRHETGSWAEQRRLQVEHSGEVQHKHSGRIEVEQLTAEQKQAARRFLATLPDEEPSLN